MKFAKLVDFYWFLSANMTKSTWKQDRELSCISCSADERFSWQSIQCVYFYLFFLGCDMNILYVCDENVDAPTQSNIILTLKTTIFREFTFVCFKWTTYARCVLQFSQENGHEPISDFWYGDSQNVESTWKSSKNHEHRIVNSPLMLFVCVEKL